ncbi:MAG: histidine--tRNA ligase [Candidatus Omnitrophica bacterium]|nr:histidine--tRNA ligase [Candidatus Omnitrophota bacterium]
MAVLKALGGTSDILAPESRTWQRLENEARQVLELYGYEEIRTPLIEEAAVFTRSLGEAAEIVTKQMYLFQDRGGRSVALRPEGTASVVRAFIEHGLDKTAGLSRLYYLGPMFRAERPQAGRRRQFHQLGVEMFGSASPYQDVEVIALLMEMLRELGVKVAGGPGDEKAAVLKLNHLGCLKCRPEWLKNLKEYFKERLGVLCEDCKVRFRTNPLRILDCKKERCHNIARERIAPSHRLCDSCRRHADQVKETLWPKDDSCETSSKRKVYFDWDNWLVRGLDYYTGTVFEVIHTGLGEKAQSAIAAGGRYDDLVREMGGVATPAVGFAVGLERILMVQEKAAPSLAPPGSAEVFVATFSSQEIPQGMELARDLRTGKISSIANLEDRPLKRQFEQADKLGVRFTLILGPDELKDGFVTVKEMATGQQRQVPKGDLLQELRRGVKGE